MSGEASTTAMARPIRIGTRGSLLAKQQTELVLHELRARHPSLEFVVHTIQTAGDRNQKDRISTFGDKGVFVRSIEAALLNKSIDMAVHSLKDVPGGQSHPALTLAAFSVREDPRDVLVASSAQSLEGLPPGSRVGTSSLRRRAQLRELRPDIEFVDIRGNVETRLNKVQAGQYDAVVLAAAGLKRLGLEPQVTEYFPADRFVPDAGQGVIAVQTRTSDHAEELARSADDLTSRTVVTAERAVAEALEADCRSPVGAFARLRGDRLLLNGMAAFPDCSFVAREQAEGSPGDAHALGIELGLALRRRLENRSIY
jgi:hydroxymethylbilane synthase